MGIALSERQHLLNNNNKQDKPRCWIWTEIVNWIGSIIVLHAHGPNNVLS